MGPNNHITPDPRRTSWMAAAPAEDVLVQWLTSHLYNAEIPAPHQYTRLRVHAASKNYYFGFSEE